MILTELQKSIYKGKTCPYCNEESSFVDSKIVYSKSYGMIYYCEDCQAWCGVHGHGKKALGRLANKELREWKIKAHEQFDKLWRGNKVMNRKLAYKYLSDHLRIPKQYTHIGMFSIATCKRVIEFANNYIEKEHEKPKENHIKVGCSYHTTWQRKKAMRFVLMEVNGTKARLQGKENKKDFFTNVSSLIFIESDYNKRKAGLNHK